jgi:hypothetical protein
MDGTSTDSVASRAVRRHADDRRDQRGAADWGALAAVGACVTALAALAMVLMVFVELRADLQRGRFGAALDSLWRLTAEWSSPDMAAVRASAAGALLDAQPNADVAAVLDFFDEVAFLLSRGVLDDEMVWYEFYRPMAAYWFASQRQVDAAQRTDSTEWEQLREAIGPLVAIEARRRQKPADAAVPTAAEIHDFLTAELSNGECDELQSAGVRRVPL